MRAAPLVARGLPVSTEALQREAADDLRLVDAARASGALRVASSKPARKPAAPLGHRAQDQASRLGGKAYVKQLPAVDRPRVARKPTGVEAERMSAMIRRIALICQKVDRAKNGEEMGKAFAYPALVTALAIATQNKDMLRGPYFGRSARDRDRIYWAEIERICDQSNAVIRPAWWVK